MHVARPRSAPLVICLQAMLLGPWITNKALPATALSAKFNQHAVQQKDPSGLPSYSSTTKKSYTNLIKLWTSLIVGAKRIAAGYSLGSMLGLSSLPLFRQFGAVEFHYSGGRKSCSTLCASAPVLSERKSLSS